MHPGNQLVGLVTCISQCSRKINCLKKSEKQLFGLTLC